MELKQVWMSRDTQKQSRYSLRTLGGILGIAMLALVLVLGGTALGFMLGWPMRLVSVGLWLGVTVLLVALALRLGQNTVRDATLYFLTRDDRLFVADVRQLAGMGHSALDWAKGTVRVQQRLREMARSPVLPAAAEEILRVEQIRENRTGYAVICQLRRFDQTVTRRTCFVIRGLEDQETLLHLLELREGWSGSPELRENHTLHGLLLSVLAAGVAGVLCVLSHPAVGQLPVGIYYFLLDPLQATGELRDGTLTLHFSQQMVYPMFNKPEIAEKFRLAVQKLTGQNVRVVMQPMDTVTQINQRKIEELAHFPNVTIR